MNMLKDTEAGIQESVYHNLSSWVVCETLPPSPGWNRTDLLTLATPLADFLNVLYTFWVNTALV